MARQKAGRSLLWLALSLAGCDALSDAVSVDPGELLTLSASPSSVPADGASRVTLTARIPAASPADQRTVTFTTNDGTFVDGALLTSDPIEVVADASGAAVVQLRAPTHPGGAIAEAKVGSLGRSVAVTFTRAYPSQALVTPADSVLHVEIPVGTEPAPQTTQVTARLLRGDGVASEGTVVLFSAVTGAGDPLGAFSAVTPSDAKGIATAEFTPGATSFRGQARIRARVADPTTGATVEGTADVQIVD